jgi:hypothetical protein
MSPENLYPVTHTQSLEFKNKTKKKLANVNVLKLQIRIILLYILFNIIDPTYRTLIFTIFIFLYDLHENDEILCRFYRSSKELKMMNVYI